MAPRDIGGWFVSRNNKRPLQYSSRGPTCNQASWHVPVEKRGQKMRAKNSKHDQEQDEISPSFIWKIWKTEGIKYIYIYKKLNKKYYRKIVVVVQLKVWWVTRCPWEMMVLVCWLWKLLGISRVQCLAKPEGFQDSIRLDNAIMRPTYIIYSFQFFLIQKK